MQQLIHSHPHQLALFSDTEVSRSYTENLLAIAQPYSVVLASGQKVTMHQVRSWMNREFGGSDAEGKWTWKDAYEAQEAALVLLLRCSKAMLDPDPFGVLSYLGLIEHNLLTQTKRDEESQKLQQFSTPLLLAYLTFLCAGSLQAQDLVLEPSAGTGMLAIWADRSGAKLVLNELSDRRVGLLRKLFPQSSVYQYNGEQIHDRLPQEHRPSIVLMNPPFSASPHVAKRYPLATVNHIRSAFARLLPGGRLVVISADWFAPTHPLWQALFKRLPQADPKLTVVVDGNAYYKHGTTIGTRITVIDKCIQSVEMRSPLIELPLSLQTEVLNDQGQRRQIRQFLPQQVKAILQAMPPRLEVQLPRSKGTVTPIAPSVPRTQTAPDSTPKGVQPAVSATFTDVVEVHFQILEQTTTLTQEAEQESIYQNYQPQRLRVVGAKPHPTQLCESVALASVQPPIPEYHPRLPQQLITDGILSEAQLESISYAGDAHAHYLRGHYKVEERGDVVSVCSPNERASVQFRQGWFLGDGTGAGKGRQLAGIILDNLLQGRPKALWISKNDKLLEDARRDWCAVGGHSTDIFALSQFKQGADIPRSSGILFLTYATLRTGEKPNKSSRLQQILKWLGSDFAGVIVFDEAHEMGNAIAETVPRGVRNASQQGLMGVRLQNLLPHARVVYASATGASKVSHLAYATRVGLWQTGDFPFADRSDFIGAIEQGGVAAMEVVCRDLKSLGLYVARNLSFAGVQYEALEVSLSPEQIALYDRYASAFQIIHTYLDEALLVCNITSGTGKSLNKQAKSSALSSFESHKQRFFNHLLTAMKCPTLIRSIEQDLAGDRAVVIQLVSTNEALLERRLAQIPTEEWNDLSIDITPREYVMDYLVHAFPIRLYQVCTDEDGNEYSEPVSDAQGNEVYSQTAIEQRQELIESLVSLPPLPGALDQLLYHFGAARLAEVTGRSLRLLQDPREGRLSVNRRSATANLSEAAAFMQGHKSILVFSDAGGTGRSYHADLNLSNQKRRVHYLLEAGWRADTAIQGLGRSHRTNQASAPIFRPVVTTVRGERRFISTIARRLDALGALTRGQRQTGGQNLFDPRDNLESTDANAALLEFFHLLYRGQIDGCRLAQFQAATGLNLLTEEGHLREELPSISKFLNRLLALPIHLQNSLFEVFEQLLAARIEAAIAAGLYDVGVEMLRAEQFRVRSRQPLFRHPTGGETLCIEVERRDRVPILTPEAALQLHPPAESRVLLVNERSQRAAIRVPTSATIDSKTGAIIDRVQLIRPVERERLSVADLQRSTWRSASLAQWRSCWQAEVDQTDPDKVDRFFMITGLLLPIWKSLTVGSLRVYRLQTDTGERLLGRVLDPVEMAQLSGQLGLGEVKLASSEIYDLVYHRRQRYGLTSGLTLHASTVMGALRLEVLGDRVSQMEQHLKASGCFTEIIDWRKRFFVPTELAIAIAVIDRLLQLQT